jgi:endonuclease IV
MHSVGTHTKWKGSFKSSLNDLNPDLPYQVMFSRLQYKLPELMYDDLEWASQHFHCFIHAPYSVQISRDHKNFEKMTDCLSATMQVAQQVNSGCVFHSGVGTPQSLAYVVDQMKLTNNARGPSLLIENAAEKTKVAISMDNMRLITEGIDFSRGIGFCLDTQHAFAAGMTTWSEDNWPEIIEQMREWRLSLVHLNDSKVPFNSGKDRHALIGNGYIWSQHQDDLIRLTHLLNEIGIPMVIE